VNQKGLIVASFQKFSCLEQAAASVEQQVALVADVNVEPEIALFFKKFHNHAAKMVYVDCDVVKARLGYVSDYSLKHGLAAYGHKCLGAVVGEWPQACSQTCGKNHCFHVGVQLIFGQG
jgi:hypothetical protein